MNWTQEQIDAAWEKGRTVEGRKPDEYRIDACGALIMKAKHGEKTPLGWEIDHIFPKSRAEEMGYAEPEINHIENLRPLHWENNKSKNDDYPDYRSSVTRKGDTNIASAEDKTVHPDVATKLDKRFPPKPKK